MPLLVRQSGTNKRQRGEGKGEEDEDLKDWRVLTSGFLDPFSAFGSEGDCGGVV